MCSSFRRTDTPFGALRPPGPLSDKKGSSQRMSDGGHMRKILSFSDDLTQDEVEHLTTLLIYHLVERCGGRVSFTTEDASQTLEGLETKMVHMQIGTAITLRIVTRPPELQDPAVIR